MQHLRLTLGALALGPAFALAQVQINLPMVPKEAVFNVPLNFNNLPPAVVKQIQVGCAVYASVNPPVNDNEAPLAGGGETVNLANGAYNGTVKVSFTVPATDVAKVKSWRCRTFAIGPTLNQFNLDLWQNLPDAAKPAPGTSPKTSASGKYD
ncbi:hypothetical protein FN976_22985 [Caenimonas sedimenti]|uniref:Uncharacterized protein n=1 Tax=Caenimonas sedimenti TaxID=2596921 RepID=A0A562ZIU0_9BURK|nr:hypothetical protein [Caenimonas sedimenti]TWO68499.1 hypothetical protein FN976_22985 [Caenimonas sedimenti]